MKTHDLIPGSAEWHAHRNSGKYFNASEAPAMMNCSPYETRNQLLHRLATKEVKEIDAATQRRFDDGHRFEALARPLAEEIMGEELYPVTGSQDEFSASFDGLTMDESKCFEHKTLNDEIRACGSAENLPLMYRVQMEQQLLVSCACGVLFLASKWSKADELIEEKHLWYSPDFELRNEIISGWEQFAADLANYTPPEVIREAVAEAQETLPAVSVNVTGSIAVIDNLQAFGEALTAYVGRINQKPQTDDDFATLDAQAKDLKKAEAALTAAEENALGQATELDTLRRTIKQYRDIATQARIAAEKTVRSEKENRKNAIIKTGGDALAVYMIGLAERFPADLPMPMPSVTSDFFTATKGLKTIASIQNAVDSELARAKVAASSLADKVAANLKTIAGHPDYKHLFVDYRMLALKEPDDLAAVIGQRITAAKEQEAKKADELRAKIAEEERAKAVAEVAKAEPAPVPAPQARVAAPQPAAVASPDRVLSSFLASREWKKGEEAKARAVIVEWEKFKLRGINTKEITS